MIYTSPKLECLGTIAGLTASDHKCTPGGDASGFTFWDDTTPEGGPAQWTNNAGDTVFQMPPTSGQNCISENSDPDKF